MIQGRQRTGPAALTPQGRVLTRKTGANMKTLVHRFGDDILGWGVCEGQE